MWSVHQTLLVYLTRSVQLDHFQGLAASGIEGVARDTKSEDQKTALLPCRPKVSSKIKIAPGKERRRVYQRNPPMGTYDLGSNLRFFVDPPFSFFSFPLQPCNTHPEDGR